MTISKLLLATAMALLMFGGGAVKSKAQGLGGGQDGFITIEMNSADVREALRAIFKSGGSYSVAPDVQGMVTVNLKNVPFETALQNILKQVDATYRVTGGVYEIIRREDPVMNDPAPQENPAPATTNKVRRKVFVNRADPQFIAKILAGSQDFGLSPEISTVVNTPGGFGGNGGFGSSGFGNSGRGNGSGNNGQGSRLGGGNMFGGNQFGNGNRGGPGRGG